MILKAGTYKWNDVPSLDGTYVYGDLNFYFTIPVEDTVYTFYCDRLSFYPNAIGYNVYSTDPVGAINPIPISLGVWQDGTWVYEERPTFRGIEVITINEDTDVADNFGSLFIANTNYNEVNALVKVEYNGETIAQLNAGETATLSCEGMKMASDVVVKVNEVESKIPEGYVKPEGTLNILQNNTTYDVSQYAEVRIATAHPYEVPLEMLMNNVISDASQATIGNVYKYTGETTDTYENGTSYILEEVSE